MRATLLVAHDPAAIATCADVLREGGVAVIPTDTFYGLAASVYQLEAVARVFAVKHRSPDSAVPVLVASAADLTLLTADVPAIAWKLIDRFWPGPLTLVFPARPAVPPLITGGTGTIAVRVPAAETCLRLLEMLGQPLVGTSANRSTAPPATTAAEALRELGEDVDAILEDDAAVSGTAPSTVVSLTDGQPLIHRVGALRPDAIREAMGMRVLVRQGLTERGAGG